MTALQTASEYWHQERDTAHTITDGAIQSLADEFIFNIDNLGTAGTLWTLMRHRSPSMEKEWTRFCRQTLGVLALSKLCRNIFQLGDENTLDGRLMPGGPQANTLPEFPEEHNGKILDARLHVPRELADETVGPYPEGADSAWYQSKDRGLYVRRAALAKPSEPYQLRLLGENIRVDFDQLETLFPYVAAGA